MTIDANALRWDGKPGHYEVYYVTMTDPSTGVGAWIRYTMLAPQADLSTSTSCSLWFVTMDPRPETAGVLARKATYPIEQMRAQTAPFTLRIADASLAGEGMEGSFEDVSWRLRWVSAGERFGDDLTLWAQDRTKHAARGTNRGPRFPRDLAAPDRLQQEHLRAHGMAL